MFRRSRFSVRPNVSATVRSASTPQEAPPANQEASVAPRETGESNDATALTDKSNVTLTEKAAASGDGSDQNVDGASSSAAVQRRKRFSVKPKVAPGRSSTLSRTPKSPVKAVSQTSVECSGSDRDKPTTSSQTGTTATPKGLQSPRRRRPSEDGKQPKMQQKPTLISLETSEPSAISPAVHPVEQTRLSADSSKQSENISSRQVKEAPPRPPDRPSLPDKESTELSEKAKTLVTSKSVLSLTPSALSLSRLLNDPSDLKRLVKAQKLRELLREERCKEKKLKKAKSYPRVFTLDPAKMTMRDLIHYLPTSNPMTVEESAQQNETVRPPSPGRGAFPEQAQEPEVFPNTVSNREEEEEAEEEQEEALMVPQVKVAEDGSLIIDETSLTVEVQRAKGPNPAENRDPIFERGSTTTYSSFRKLNHAKHWTSEETDMFFLAVSMVGTDFSMICQLFPHRARSEIKNKFKKEERENSWRIDKAIRERRKLDIEYFSKLLEKILEYHKSKKKLRSLAEKNSSQKGNRKTNAKKSSSKLSDVEEEDEEDENEVLELGEEEEEEEGEKENEDLCNDGEMPVSEAKMKKGKRKNRQTALDEEPNDKRNKRVSTEQGEDGMPEDTEAGLPQSHKDSDMSDKTQNVNTAKDTAVKPAKLSRGRAPKPLLRLGGKWSKKPTPCTTAKNTSSDKEEESVNKDASSLGQDDDDVSSEEDDIIVNPPRPTRCGRVPKPTKPLTYPAKEKVHSSASDTTPSSAVDSTASAGKPKTRQTAKRRISPQPDSAPKSKKSKLVTLTASQTEFSDEEGHQWQDEEVEEVELAGSPSKDSSAPVFVPAGLHTPHPQIKEVDETIAELDILATMPDVLGISQDALCPDSACEQAQHETGSAEPCEHQLDLLIDVIEFISSEHAEEVSEDQSYNEAAQTLLTIGNLTHVSPLAQNQIIIPDHVTGEASAGVSETSHVEKELTSKPALEEKSATPSVSTFGQDLTQTSETVATAKQDSLTDNGEVSIIKTGDEPNPESSNKNSPQSKRGRFSKVKPKPNLGRVSRTAQPKSQSAISAVRIAEESHTVPPNITDCSPALPKSDISSAEVKLTVEPSDSQLDVDGVESGAATSEQSSSEIQIHCSPESQCELSRDQSARETQPLSEPADKMIGQESCTNLPPVKESGAKPHPCVSPAEDLSVSQKGESEATNTCQSRRSRLQKVKPKPNLSQTSRTVRSKPQTTTQPEDRNLISNPTFHKKAIAEPTCTTSEEQCQSPDSDSVKPLFNLGSALTPPEELSTNEEKKSDVGPQQSIQENQNSESLFEHSNQLARNTGSTSDFTVEKVASHAGTTKNSCDKVVTSDSAVTVSQVGQGGNVDSAPAQEGSDHPPVFTTSAEELPLIQKEGEVVSTSQLKRTRLLKLKPKPNLPQTSRTARFKPQTTKQPEERDPVPTQDPKPHKQTIVDPQLCTTSPEQQSQSADPAAVLKPTLDSDSTRIPREGLSTNEEKNADGGLDLGAVISDCSAPKYQSSESQFELKKDQATDTKPSSEPSSESYVGTAKAVFGNSATSDFAVTEVERESCTDLDRGQENTEKPPAYVSPAEDLPVGQKVGSEVTPTFLSTRSRMQKVKPKPNLTQTSRISRCKTQTTKEAVEEDKSPTQNTRLPETTRKGEDADSGSVQESSVHHAVLVTPVEELPLNQEKSEVESASQLSQIKPQPRLPQTSRTVQFKSTTDPLIHMQGEEKSCSQTCVLDSTDHKTKDAEAQPSCSPNSPEKSNFKIPDTGSVSEPSLELGSTHKYTEELSSTEKEKTDVVCGPMSGSVSLEQNVPQRSRRFPKVKPKPNLGSSTRIAHTKVQPADISQPTQHCSVDTISNIASGQQPADNNNAQKPVKFTEKDLPSGHCSLNAEVCSALDTSDSKDSHQADPDSAVGCLAQVNEQQSERDRSSNNSQVPLICVEQLSSTQNASKDIQSYPIFQGMLPEQVPSDPDEPFFILSLTEIPLSSSGEVVHSATEHPSDFSVTESSIPQLSSVSGESVPAGGEGSLPNVPMPMFAEKKGVMGLLGVSDIEPDPSVVIGHAMEKKVDPCESTTDHPPKFPDRVDNNETEILLTKQRRTTTGRRAKLQVMSSSVRRKRTSKTLSAEASESAPTHTNTTQDMTRSMPSVEPKPCDAVTEIQMGNYSRDKEILTDGKGTNSSSGAHSSQSSGSACQRKPRDSLSSLPRNKIAPSQNLPPRKPASKRSKVKTPLAEGKQSLPEPVASTSHDVASTRIFTQPLKETHSTSIEQTAHGSDQAPSTSQCADEPSDCMDGSFLDEEPTGVSQYFLSDIFTEVEEG